MIRFVTGNVGKYLVLKKTFEDNDIELIHENIDLPEPSINDVVIVSKEKAKEAYDILNKPVLVNDSGFCIVNYPGNPNYPGAFVKRSGISTNIDKLLNDLKFVKDREAYFIDCLTFYDGDNFYQFTGKSEGTISLSKRGEYKEYAKSDLWYVFIPKNYDKTLAEMTKEEIYNRDDNEEKASLKFIKWYKNEYKK